LRWSAIHGVAYKAISSDEFEEFVDAIIEEA
jgi:hypothetical protein